MEKLEKMILFFVRRLGRSLNRTKLVKLLFLADLEAKRKTGETISGVKYLRYHHGPFAFEIFDAIDRMNGYEIVQYSYEMMDGAVVYTYDEGPEQRLDMNLGQEINSILEEVARTYGSKSTQEILDYVYDLPELREAQPLDIVLS